METLKYRFNLDCNKIGIQRTLQGIQTGDVMARQCVISLTAGSTPVEFPTDDSVVAMMYVKTPSATEPSINACEVDQTAGTVTYDILESDIAEAGIVTMQVKVLAIKNGVQRVLVAPKFELEIEESDVSDSEAETSPSFSALEQAIAKAQEVYNSRLISVTVNEEHIIVVTYADGTTYESTGLIDTYRDLMDDTYGNFYTEITQAELFKTEAATSAQTAAGYRDEAETQANDSRLSAEDAHTYANISSAYATGYDLDGNLVPPPQPSYRNNAKFYADLSKEQVDDAEAWARGTRGGVPVEESDPAYHNNAKHYSDNAAAIVGSEFLSYEVAQDLTEAQQLTARTNIGAASSASVTALESAFQTDITALDEKVQEDISAVESKAQEASEKATEVDSRVTELEGTIPIVDQALNPYSENAIANKAVVDFTQLIIEKAQRNVTVATTAWHDDTTYTEYPYAAEIPYTGSTRITTYAEIVFSPSQVSSGIFAPVCESTMESIIIYASEIPSEDIVIPFVKVSAVGVWN